MNRVKTQVSFIIRDEVERLNRSGVNSMCYDSRNNRLFTAGRDSIIRIWNAKQNIKHEYISSLSHHTDWVNDIVLCNNGRNLISASSDTTIKFWNLNQNTCMSTIKTHQDYVKCLAYAKDREWVASGGFDKAIYLWDVRTLATLAVMNNTITVSLIGGNKSSVYSLAMNSYGTVLVSGSPENCIRMWDPRSRTKVGKLVGHTGNIRALLLNQDGTLCISGSSDGHIRLWSVGQDRCVETLKIHSDSVWSLYANESFNKIYSGGRDKNIFLTHLRGSCESVCIAQENGLVLKVVLGKDENILWASTTNTSVNSWDLRKFDNFWAMPESHLRNIDVTTPASVIKGGPQICDYCVLDDRRRIMTKDSDRNVSVYDILQARCLENLGNSDYEKEIHQRQRHIFIPSWFTVDLKLGMLTITLDETDCYSAWIYSHELLCDDNNDNTKENLGIQMLSSLFRYWPEFVKSNQKQDATFQSSQTKIAFFVPPHIPIIFSEVPSGRTLFWFQCKDAGGDTEKVYLKEVIPSWITDVLIEKRHPRISKISFSISPYNPTANGNSVKPRRDYLSASDLMTIQRIAAYIYSKYFLHEQPSANEHNPMNTDGHALDIYCQDKILDPSIDIRTVRHVIWKGTGDLKLFFKLRS